MIFRTRFVLFISFLLIYCLALSCRPQEARVNQKKIERERAKRHNQALDEYHKAVKRHKNMQTKSTKASMKKTKKESQKTKPSIH